MVSRMDDLILADRVRELTAAIESTRALARETGGCSAAELVDAVGRQAQYLQHFGYLFMSEAAQLVGARQITRVQLALQLFAEATKCTGLALKHLPKEKVISGDLVRRRVKGLPDSSVVEPD